jgi:very-short-patch-repair endonuclease
MTKAENEFFDVVINAAGSNCYVFPQVHLSEILDHKVKGQNWQHALHYINQKSVDYVICDKTYRRPLLAIELDDRSHDSESRQQRDANVERILQEAEIPLLRFRDIQGSTSNDIAARIQSALQPSKSATRL